MQTLRQFIKENHQDAFINYTAYRKSLKQPPDKVVKSVRIDRKIDEVISSIASNTALTPSDVIREALVAYCSPRASAASEPKSTPYNSGWSVVRR